MTKQEIQALMELLNRTLLTTAERLWLQELFNRLAKDEPDNKQPEIKEQ